ncbi:hypothetical protein, partial [Acidovorax temperans]|uniref:hypothetical protein n=1 Tax=Acidovorax temperans TaxID=80878 RepID=UPI0035B078E0
KDVRGRKLRFAASGEHGSKGGGTRERMNKTSPPTKVTTLAAELPSTAEQYHAGARQKQLQRSQTRQTEAPGKP